MSYSDIAEIAQDGGLRRRILACAWLEKVPTPEQWAADNAWPLAASPGWSEAWASARAANPDDPAFRPGADETVITDGMILAAVTALSQEGAP